MFWEARELAITKEGRSKNPGRPNHGLLKWFPKAFSADKKYGLYGFNKGQGMTEGQIWKARTEQE
jgi:hypothetical protein